MKNTALLFALSFVSFFSGNSLIYAQSPVAPKIAPAAIPGKSGSASSTVLNLVNTPIAIEKDLDADKYFQKALVSFDHNDIKDAATLIRAGAQEMLKESPKNDQNPQYKLVEQRIGELYGLSLRVESGMVHDREVLQDQFANADESLAHRYYESTNTLIDDTPAFFADRLLGLSVHLRNSKEYHIPAEKAQIGSVANEAADLAASIRQMKSGERELSPELKARLNTLMANTKALKLDE